MNTIDDKMYLTKEMHNIQMRYVEQHILPDFFSVACYGKFGETKGVERSLSGFFLSLVGNYDQTLGYRDVEGKFSVEDFVKSFVEKLDETDRYALRLYVLAKEDECFYNQYESGVSELEESDSSWGRYKAEMLYSKIQLDEEVVKQMAGYISRFVAEIEPSTVNEGLDFLCDFDELIKAQLNFIRS